MSTSNISLPGANGGIIPIDIEKLYRSGCKHKDEHRLYHVIKERCPCWPKLQTKPGWAAVTYNNGMTKAK